jgi:hypothetical protein
MGGSDLEHSFLRFAFVKHVSAPKRVFNAHQTQEMERHKVSAICFSVA